jgi:hypothetical protein
VSGVSLPSPGSRIAPERPGASWRRVVAAVADYGLVGVYIGLLSLAGASARAAGLLPEQLTTQPARWAAQLASIGLLTMPVTLWLAWREAAPGGATPGKRLLGHTWPPPTVAPCHSGARCCVRCSRLRCHGSWLIPRCGECWCGQVIPRIGRVSCWCCWPTASASYTWPRSSWVLGGPPTTASRARRA